MPAIANRQRMGDNMAKAKTKAAKSKKPARKAAPAKKKAAVKSKPAAPDVRNLQGAFGWVELVTADVDKALNYYTQVLGWTAKPMNIGDMKYTVINASGRDVGGIRKPSPDEPPGTRWDVYITVKDIAATARKAEQAGGRIIMPPTAVPGVGKMMVFSDPIGGMSLAFQYDRPFS
jgi:predicted enzyme related to lactoylglutathione lyase